jgi:hypothetical protein
VLSIPLTVPLPLSLPVESLYSLPLAESAEFLIPPLTCETPEPIRQAPSYVYPVPGIRYLSPQLSLLFHRLTVDNPVSCV